MWSFFVYFIKLCLKSLIIFYRLGISPYLGRNCRFTPSCSQYALIVLERHGIFYGIYLIIRRLMRCHPFHKGGTDLPP